VTAVSVVIVSGGDSGGSDSGDGDSDSGDSRNTGVGDDSERWQ
jgi:hypothetical protein